MAATAGGSGSFALVAPSVSHPYLTAKATDAAKGTSEFSDVYLTMLPAELYLPLSNNIATLYVANMED